MFNINIRNLKTYTAMSIRNWQISEEMQCISISLIDRIFFTPFSKYLVLLHICRIVCCSCLFMTNSFRLYYFGIFLFMVKVCFEVFIFWWVYKKKTTQSSFFSPSSSLRKQVEENDVCLKV